MEKRTVPAWTLALGIILGSAVALIGQINQPTGCPAPYTGNVCLGSGGADYDTIIMAKGEPALILKRDRTITAGPNWTQTAGATTMTGPLIFTPDNTYDIGANGATRPKNGWFAGSLVVAANGQFGNSVIASTYQTQNGVFGSGTAPTVSSGFGTGAVIAAHNGTLDFIINVGTTSATTGVIGLPATSTGWTVRCEDITTFSTTVFLTRQTASSTTTATIGGFTSAAAAQAWTNNDLIRCLAAGY